MLLRIEDHDPLPVPAAEDAPAEGFLGRIGGPLGDGRHRTIELWHTGARAAASRGGAETWHCLQDIAGIYDGVPRALLSANHLRIEHFRVDPERREDWVRHQRRRRNPRLAEAEGFLAGSFATRPDHPGCFLELGLWQTRDQHVAFAKGPDDELPGPRELETRDIAVLRRLNREPDLS